ncbi:hypothetical protein VTK26DRAFT_7720 [Humicola hyalothermophila]
MEDDDWKRNLQALTGDQDTWEDFDPSIWRAIAAFGAQQDGMSETSPPDLTPASQGDDDYDSDDSATMIFNHHKLKPAKSCKLNKARALAAEEPTVVRDPKELEKVDWKETGLSVGDVSPEGLTFVPWNFVEDYPDMFVGKRNGDRVRPLFSLDALHDNRVWDLYYIHKPKEEGKNEKPILLVPTYQFQHLLDVVNAKMETQLTIPPGRPAEKFNLSFGLGNSPRPRFLGRSTTAEAFQTLYNSVPGPHPDDELSKATQLGREEFERLLGLTHGRGKTSKSDRNRTKRIHTHRSWGRSIKRIQRYLGLRRRVGNGSNPSVDVSPVFDPNQPTPHQPEGLPLFVAIDIEAYEFNQNIITEVGIAVLDTARTVGIAPGKGGEGWFSLIQARHIRVKENLWALNKKYVHGCPDNFDFGMSEIIKNKDVVPNIIQVIDKAASTGSTGKAPEHRPVVLVFHESFSDIKFLETLGYSVYDAGNVLEVVDTKEMHQYVTRSNNSASLASVLSALGIPHQHLHNAGNDAVYTLRAMIGLAVKRRLQSLEGHPKKPKSHITFSEFKKDEGWTSGGEDSDGGEPVRPVKLNVNTKDNDQWASSWGTPGQAVTEDDHWETSVW